jgi:hypothetical protein
MECVKCGAETERLSGICEKCIDRSTDELEEGLAQEGLKLADPTDEANIIIQPEVVVREQITAVINIAPRYDEVIRLLVEQGNDLLRVAEERVIKDHEDLKPATDDLSIMAKIKKEMLEKKKEEGIPVADTRPPGYRERRLRRNPGANRPGRQDNP